MPINPDPRDNAFDLIRLLAASAVLFSHQFATSGRPEPRYFGNETAGSLGVFVFFAVSGYLVQQSWDRRPHAGAFLASRALRIFPGLLVCLALCAFVLGPIVSGLGLADYLARSEVYRFLASNVPLFFISGADRLPDVFTDNPLPLGVNGSLWMIRYEVFMCLVLLTVAAVFRKKSVWVLAMLVAVSCGIWLLGRSMGLREPGELLWRLNALALGGQLLRLAPFFLLGALCARLPDRWLSLPAAVLLALATLPFHHSSWAIPVLWFSLPYVLIVCARHAPRALNRVGRYGDFSYGLYLYAFPVQQVLAWLGVSTAHEVLGFFLAFAITMTLAVASWRWVEHPALQLRGRLQRRAAPVPGGSSVS